MHLLLSMQTRIFHPVQLTSPIPYCAVPKKDGLTLTTRLPWKLSVNSMASRGEARGRGPVWVVIAESTV